MVPFDDEPRESPRCLHCGSVPRHRALAQLVKQRCGDLRTLHIHESSPSTCTARWLTASCRNFTGTYFVPGKRQLARLGVFWNVDLGHQPFDDGAFDLVITQDVLEHVPDPQRALREIERTLRPGGRHIFTVPRSTTATTTARAERRGEAWIHLQPAVHHRDPTSRRGSLVVTDWGTDLERLVAAPPFQCQRYEVVDPAIGVATPVEVFVVERTAVDQGS